MASVDKVVDCLVGVKQDPLDPHHLSTLANAVQQLFQEGLVGNRTVSRGDVWGLVTAATRAFPIQLSPSVEKAQEVLAAGAADGNLLHTWIIQAAADGSLPVLVQKLRSQPQILTAYARDAPMRQPAIADNLVTALQELQGLILASPYDKHLQAKAAATPASDQPTVHIQTELDLIQQQQQQPLLLVSPASSTAGGSGSSSAESSSSGQGKAAGVGSSATSNSQHQPEHKQQQQQGLVSRLRSTRLPQLGSFTKKGSQQQQQQQQQCDAQLLRVQLIVLPPEQQSSTADTLVQLQIQVVQPHQQQGTAQKHLQTKQQPQPSPRGAAAVSSSGNSITLDTGVPPSGSSVKGLLQGLHQSAASGLQQAAATAAGQDLQGAVAAAGGAVAAAFGSVKGLKRFKTGKKQQGQSTTVAAGAGVVGTAGVSSSKGKAGSKQGLKGSTAATAEAGAGAPVVAVQLLLRSAEDAAVEGPVQLQLTVLPAAAAAAGDAGWSSRGMLGRLRLARGSGSTNTSTSSSRTQSQQQEVTAEALGVEQQQQQQCDMADPLEGDMWSVMSRLKASSTTGSLLAAKTAEESAADTAAAAAVQQLQESGTVLQEQLLSCCKAVCTAAGSTTGPLGEESSNLLQLIEHIKCLLNHGLNNSSSIHSGGSGPATGANSSSRGNTPEPGASGSSSVTAAVKAAATARDMLGGLLMHGRQQSAFGVLQALQHGSKQQPRLMLGADGIANMKAAKSAPPATKLDLWVRASLNEQLLGVRVSTLLANPDALKPWYHPQALLLQHGHMAAVMQDLQELSQFRFALPVDATGGVPVGHSVAAVREIAGVVMTQQQQSRQGAAGSAVGSGDANSSKGSVAAGAAASGASSGSKSSSSMAAALDPRKYFGSFNAGLGSLRGSSATTQAPAAAMMAAAGSNGSNAASSSNPAIPTFLWGATAGARTSSGHVTPRATTPTTAPAAAGSIGAAGATAAAAAVTAATAATGGFFRRRRVPQIKEVRVPAPGSGAVLSREPSSTLSPMSTEDETAYAEWWNPNNGSQDLSAAVAAAMDGNSGSNGAAQGRRLSSSNSLRSYGSTGGGQPGSSSGTPGAAAMAATAATTAAGIPRSASRQSRADSEVSTGATSEAALQLEQDLQAAMSAPLLVEQFSSSRRSSSGRGGSNSSSSSGGGGDGVGICRSGSAGWDAAVAAARARAKEHTGVGYTGGGVSASVGLGAGGLNAGAFAALSRRSKSPEPDVRRMGEGAGGGVGGGVGRRPRHMHKRSSSLNDLPELEALWMDAGGRE